MESTSKQAGEYRNNRDNVVFPSTPSCSSCEIQVFHYNTYFESIIELTVRTLAAHATSVYPPFTHPCEYRQPIPKDCLARVCAYRESSVGRLAVLGLHDAALLRTALGVRSSIHPAYAGRAGSQLSWSGLRSNTRASQPRYGIRRAEMLRIYGATHLRG